MKSIILLTIIFVATRVECDSNISNADEDNYVTQLVHDNKELMAENLIKEQGFHKVSNKMEMSPLGYEDIVPEEREMEDDMEFQEHPEIQGFRAENIVPGEHDTENDMEFQEERPEILGSMAMGDLRGYNLWSPEDRN